MNNFSFSITINLNMTVEQDKIALSVKNVDLNPAMIGIPIQSLGVQIEPISEQKTYHQIIKEVAKEYISQTGNEIFTAADLYNRAKQKYPHLKRNTFNNRVMAAAPEHTSYKHLMGTKDFLKFLGEGKYKLKKEVI